MLRPLTNLNFVDLLRPEITDVATLCGSLSFGPVSATFFGGVAGDCAVHVEMDKCAINRPGNVFFV